MCLVKYDLYRSLLLVTPATPVFAELFEMKQCSFRVIVTAWKQQQQQQTNKKQNIKKNETENIKIDKKI